MNWNSSGTRQWCIENVPLRWRFHRIDASFCNKNFNAKHEEFSKKNQWKLEYFTSIGYFCNDEWWSMFHLITYDNNNQYRILYSFQPWNFIIYLCFVESQETDVSKSMKNSKLSLTRKTIQFISNGIKT